MLRRHAPALYSVDAGGSRTGVAVWRSGELVKSWTCESFAIASAGEDHARSVLEDVLTEIRGCLELADATVGCIASSSMPVGDEAPPPRLLLDLIARTAPAGRVVIVNDVIPLLWAPPLAGAGVVVCSGTGSSVIGRAANGRLVKVGGHEHIVSDQGSAYSIAREGLRAAARDVDGTGPSTKLRAAAEAFFELPMPALGRWLAELPRPRTTVAGFAPSVSAAAQDGDTIAAAIIEQEIDALAESVAVAVQRLALTTPSIGLAGGVLHGSPYVRGLLEASLGRLGLTDARRANLHLVDGITAGAGYATRLRAGGAEHGNGAGTDATTAAYAFEGVGSVVLDVRQ